MDQHQDAPALTDRLEQIRERVEAASEGPWEIIGGGEYVTGAGICVAPDDGGVTLKDAKFIAHARQDVPWLLAEVERLAAAEAEKRDRSAAIDHPKDARDIILTATLHGVRIGDLDFIAGTTVTVPVADADRLITANLAKENTHDA